MPNESILPLEKMRLRMWWLSGQRFRCSKLTEREAARLQKLEETLHKRVIGQEEAVNAVATGGAAGTCRTERSEADRSVLSCFWDRPASEKQSYPRHWRKRCLADENAMIRVDMSEYMEKAQRLQNDRITAGICGI